MDSAARPIRRRIIWLILSAFIDVVLVTLLIVTVVTAIAINNNLDNSPLNKLPILARLEGYYVGHGGWDRAQVILQDASSDSGNQLVIVKKLTLLDATVRIVLDRGASDTARVGTIYQSDPNETMLNLEVEGNTVGSIVLDRETAPSRLGVISPILMPVSLVAVLLAFLAILVFALLSRRIVNPLAEVIAASRAVTAGKLEARVEVQGPQDLVVLTDSFNQMAASLERNDHERRDLLADIAHELRTPLSAIRGRLEGMLDGVYPYDQHHISLALKANYMLERLVEDLRFLTLAETHQLHFEKKETDQQALAVRSLEMFCAEAQEKDIQLQLLPASGDYIAFLDPQRTEQVIGNLVSDALRYTPAGGKVWLVLEKNDTQVTISVCDDDPGIPEEDLPSIFNRFWRKDKSRACHTGGSGLGLAIAKQLIEVQGGSISAENLPAGGRNMRIKIPRG
jgi:signal transduction histidine kinase